MQDPPFNVAMLLFAIYLGVFVLGAVSAEVLSLLNLPVFAVAFLAAFIPFPIGGKIRSLLGGLLARVAGKTGPQPFAFSLVTRLVLGAVCALLVAAGYTALGIERVDAVLGGAAALAVVITLSAVFLFNVMFFQGPKPPQ